jgi:hypothetical protein
MYDVTSMTRNVQRNQHDKENTPIILGSSASHQSCTPKTTKNKPYTSPISYEQRYRNKKRKNTCLSLKSKEVISQNHELQGNLSHALKAAEASTKLAATFSKEASRNTSVLTLHTETN